MQKVVVITGASSGIGKATANLLISNKNKVVLAARRKDKLDNIFWKIILILMMLLLQKLMLQA